MIFQEAKKSEYKALRLYPFGPKIYKSLNWEEFDSEESAISKAFSNIPDVTNQLPNVVDNKNTILRDFIQQAYSTIPTKFPVILFTGNCYSTSVRSISISFLVPSAEQLLQDHCNHLGNSYIKS